MYRSLVMISRGGRNGCRVVSGPIQYNHMNYTMRTIYLDKLYLVIIGMKTMKYIWRNLMYFMSSSAFSLFQVVLGCSSSVVTVATDFWTYTTQENINITGRNKIKCLTSAFTVRDWIQTSQSTMNISHFNQIWNSYLEHGDFMVVGLHMMAAQLMNGSLQLLGGTQMNEKTASNQANPRHHGWCMCLWLSADLIDCLKENCRSTYGIIFVKIISGSGGDGVQQYSWNCKWRIN